uniref:15-cis-phytoene synthase n=1 Tax=Crassostrea virginica TaxID=6565 RepID=A0A8B8EUG2_CRAVI|nr:NADH dehydrogenase (ubiquinone) complex I, assembly factor 6-like [Crassostrea virginica]
MAASLRIISRGCAVGVKQDRCLYSKLKNHHASYLNLKRNAAVVANIPKKSFDYCYNLTKQNDYEHYLCSLLLQRNLRAAAIVLRAYNIEIAKIGDNVKDSFMGRGRFVFWKEALEEIYDPNGKIPQTPVVQLLNWAVNDYKISKIWLTRIIDARESNQKGIFNSIQDLDNYYEQVVSSMYYMLLELHGVKDVQADHAASHLGRCYGMVSLLRAIPAQLSTGKVLIPHDLLAKHSVSQEDIRRGENKKGVSDIAYDIASTANSHLTKARSLKDKVPKAAVPAFLPSVFCEDYLKNLQIVDFNIFEPSLNRRRFLYHKLLLQKYKKTY